MTDDKNNGNGPREPEIDESSEALTAPPVSSLDAITRGEISSQVATAKRYPRSLKKSIATATDMATLDQETAESCFYRLERKAKDGEKVVIEGPSIRLAEIFGIAWGNLRFGSRVIDEQERFVVVQGYAADLENNIAAAVEVARRIAGRRGRYSDDMIQTTIAAAQSIAVRNAILRVVPRTYVDHVLEKAKQVAVGDIKELAKVRQKVIERLAKLGVAKDRVFAKLGVASIEEVGRDHVEALIGFGTAIKEGTAKAEELFPPIVVEKEPAAAEEKPASSASVAAHVAQQAAAEPEPLSTPSTPGPQETATGELLGPDGRPL